MNEREKKLLFMLLGAAFIIVNVFLYSSYSSGMQRMKSELNAAKTEYRDKTDELARADERASEREWLLEYQPKEGDHRGVGTALAKYTEDTARRYGVQMNRRPQQVRENLGETGVYRSATVKVMANGRDAEIVRWLTDLQDPRKSRSITRLEIEPEKNDKTQTRMSCELEVTQWFSPAAEEDTETADNPES